VDVRDVAKMHILALKSKPSTVVGRKRFLITSPHTASYKAALEFIAAERPELKSRLGDPNKAHVQPAADVERKKLEEAVGFAVGDYTPWKDTVVDAIDRLIDMENSWKAKGLEFEMPTNGPM
jgi:nucleoside-diphosphate-sugar epimerase